MPIEFHQGRPLKPGSPKPLQFDAIETIDPEMRRNVKRNRPHRLKESGQAQGGSARGLPWGCARMPLPAELLCYSNLQVRAGQFLAHNEGRRQPILSDQRGPKWVPRRKCGPHGTTSEPYPNADRLVRGSPLVLHQAATLDLSDQKLNTSICNHLASLPM
jgi:hypothetical protein